MFEKGRHIIEQSIYNSRCYPEYQNKPLANKYHQNFSFILHRTRKGNPKIMWKYKNNSKLKSNAGNIEMPTINLHYLATVTETAWYPQKNKWCQANRMETWCLSLFQSKNHFKTDKDLSKDFKIWNCWRGKYAKHWN